jgi:glycosyltransferase involved in cell wall biosynthesis
VSSSSEEALRTVAFLPPRLVSGGTQRHLLEVLRFIDRGRFRPLVVSAKSGGELGRAVTACGVELVELHLGDRMASRDFLRCVRETAALFRRCGVDVVQYFAWRPGLLAIAATLLAGRGRLVAGRRSTPQEQGVRALLEDLVVRLADRIVVNAESLRPRGRAARRTDVIPSGVDTERFRAGEPRAQAKARLDVPAARPVIGTVGRLEARKGTATLIEAAARLRAEYVPDLLLVVAGDGPLSAELSALAARLGIAEHVRLLGDRPDVREVLAALDVFVLPSRTEGMSNALLEAMAMERPVVATAVGGTPEVMGRDPAGVLVPAADPDAMARAVARLLAAPDLAARLGSAARRRVEEHYGARAMVRRLEAVYAAVAAPDGVAARVRPATAGEHA